MHFLLESEPKPISTGEKRDLIGWNMKSGEESLLVRSAGSEHHGPCQMHRPGRLKNRTERDSPASQLYTSQVTLQALAVYHILPLSMKVPESDARCVARSQWTGLEGAVTVVVYPMDWSGGCSDCHRVPNGLVWRVQ